MTTLNEPDNTGIPLHMIKVDQSGRIIKRISFSGFAVPRYSGACVRWGLFEAFSQPGKIYAQHMQFPDSSQFVMANLAIRKGSISYREPSALEAIGIGCMQEHTEEFIYADQAGGDKFDAVGSNCRICERTNCAQRNQPNFRKNFVADVNRRGVSPFGPPPQIDGLFH
ncbi:MAG: short-chain fatty acyl-CoA regulator family protein [Pseudomonadota bacterium]